MPSSTDGLDGDMSVAILPCRIQPKLPQLNAIAGSGSEPAVAAR